MQYARQINIKKNFSTTRKTLYLQPLYHIIEVKNNAENSTSIHCIDPVYMRKKTYLEKYMIIDHFKHHYYYHYIIL